MALGAALVEPLVWYAYYWVALFVLEERLWRIVSAAPLRVLRRSWFATWAYAPLHAVALALFGYVLPAAAATLRSACLADRGCRGRLRSDAWGFYDDNDAQWRKFRSALPLLAAAAAATVAAARAFGARARFLGGLAFVAAAHGSHAPFVLAWCAAFHGAARAPRRLARPAVWALVLLALACKERAWPLRRRMTWAYVASAPRLDARGRAGKESEIPNFKGSYLGRVPLVSADFWTSDHLLERPRSVDAFSGTRARGTLTLKRR